MLVMLGEERVETKGMDGLELGVYGFGSMIQDLRVQVSEFRI